MGNFFYNYEPATIICVNSFAPTEKQFEYVVEVYPHDDDTPSLNMYRFANKTRYNH